MRIKNVDIDQLKRSKASSSEAKLEWLWSAVQFAKAEKKVVKKKSLK